MILYVARLRLLDYGMLKEAEDIAHETLQLQQVPTEASTSNVMDVDSGEAADSSVKTESVAEFSVRIHESVRNILRTAVRGGARRGKDTTGSVYAARRAVVAQFTRAIMAKSCPHCKAISPTLRKDGFIKIVERELSERDKMRHDAMGIRRPDVISLASARRKGKSTVDTEESHQQSVDKERLKEAKKASKDSSTNTRVMLPLECRANLRMTFEREAPICNLIFGRQGLADADMFFMEVISVSPTRFRPASQMGDTTFENPQNELLTKVIRTCLDVRRLSDSLAVLTGKSNGPIDPLERARATDALMSSLVQLQVDVNCFIDSSKSPQAGGGGIQPTPGVKQALEKKEGLFRKHMMGKRVNFAARSVISPDVNIETNEIGVPPVFAKKLTFNEPVTVHNVERMRKIVVNGPDVYPGAVAVRSEDGTETLLGPLSVEQRTALANQLLTPQEHTSRQAKGTFAGLGASTITPPANKQVLRHLIDGDVLIMNRQPTLHKPSMMAHRARVLKGERTIRMHYANCNSYNADFDGDEMNMHFPQSQAARAESYNIANTDNQYLVATSGNPLRGLIQDHVIAGVWMTSKNTLYSREEYQQMLYGALRPENNYSGGGRVRTLPPAIFKPQALWTGKQVISTILLNIKPEKDEGLNMSSKSKVNGKLWGKGNEEEGTVNFRDGELLTGILDKSQFGASAYGLVHAVYEIYGAEIAGKLLSIFSRLFTKWLQSNAFTCRMDDLLLSERGDQVRRNMLDEGKDLGREAAIKTVGLSGETADDYNMHVRLEEVLRDDDKQAVLDSSMLGAARELRTKVIAELLPGGQHRVFPENNFEMMVSSGAKGSLVNFSQISALLGSQELEGRRVPVMVSGKSLPSFKPFDTSLRAGGFVAQRFLTGIRPQEYYFHCMSGREGLIDTAVKTSRSGYLQRCLIKHLEGISVHYDNTVRNSDGTVIQFLYGEDGLDVTKSKYLDQLDFTAENFESFMRRYPPRQLAGVIDEQTASDYSKKAIKKPHKYAPVMSMYNPARFMGSTSEKFAIQLQKYIEENARGLLEQRKKSKSKNTDKEKIQSVRPKVASEWFKLMNQVLYHHGLAEPGEGVGLVAAQSVGEPSTQMTLNTFHLAGHGAANVTLGIPRLREIVMTASQNIKTPIMKLPILQGISQEQKLTFCKDGSRLLLSQVVQDAVVKEKISAKTISSNFKRVKSYTIQLNLFPIEECKEEYNVGVAEILRGIEMTFAPILEREIGKEIKRLARDRVRQRMEIGKGHRFNESVGDTDGADNEGADEPGTRSKNSKANQAKSATRNDDSDDEEQGDEDGAGDGDADEEKRKSRSEAHASYDDDDDDDSEGTPAPDTEESIDAAFSESGKRHKHRKSQRSSSDSEGSDEADSVDAGRRDIAQQVEELDAKLQEQSKFITSFDFDRKKHGWIRLELQLPNQSDKLLLIGVVERACRTSVVHEVPRIGRVICPTEANNTDQRLTAEGINLPGMWEFGYGIVELNSIYTNDIGALLHTYGVEAARQAIVDEMRAIFDTYGINVSPRHLQLISDYQTSTGGFLPFSRGGLTNAPSPLLKASYETTMGFLSQAALFGEVDDLSSPSGNIVVGRPIKGGTGMPQICTQIPTA